jgi:hypothetical protein
LKEQITSARTHSPQMTEYATSQMITRILFSLWEHTKLQISTFRERVNFETGFKEKVTVISTRPVSRFKFYARQISNEQKKRSPLENTSV